MNQLEYLKKNTSIAIDSANLNLIKKYNIQNITTNPSLILQNINLKIYNELLNNAIKYAKKKNGNKKTQIINTRDKFTVNICHEIIKKTHGQISIEIDITFAFDINMSIIHAKKILKLFKKEKIDLSRILIKIPATWEGIQAAKELEKQGIRCNLTLIFSSAQARSCAESKVFIISPFVGRIYDWYTKKNKQKKYNTKYDQGIKFVKKIYKKYKEYQYQTKIMGASFRKIEQVLSLNGCDFLTIPPKIIQKLIKNKKKISIKKLNIKNYKTKKHFQNLSEQQFRWKHNQNNMASFKLTEGIINFFSDQKKLENIIEKKLRGTK